MPKKRTSKVVKNDFEYDEGEVCGFMLEKYPHPCSACTRGAY